MTGAAVPAFAQGDPGGYNLLFLDRKPVKWGEPDGGTPAEIRYMFLKAPVTRQGAFNCRAMNPFPERLDAGGPGFPDVVRAFEAAFAAWQDAAGIRFHEVQDIAAANLLLGVQANPRGIAFADVIRDASDDGTFARASGAAVCLNPGVAWDVGFDGDRETYDVRYIALHEIGHVIGLDHVHGRVPRVMSFKYTETFVGLQPGDIAGALALYGKPAVDAPAIAELPSPALLDAVVAGPDSGRIAK